MQIRLVAACLLSVFLTMPALAAAEAAPALVLAEVYRNAIDPAGYWVSEKLDGVRAYWDGRKLYFRSGHPVPAPAWFTRDFPTTPLDGELWLGRNTFERLSGIVRKAEPVDAEWRQVRYMLFELPGAEGTFTTRKDRLAQWAEHAGIPWLQAVEQFRVADQKTLLAKLDSVVAAGGEGLMLHRADAPYTAGRSDDLVKLKPYLDREAKVVAHLPGAGRNTGRLGALLVADDNGRSFRVGTGFSDAQREAPPPVGSTITYRYRGLTAKGLPRFPVFLRLRETF
ncbi:MAG: DNA ligase [Hydrogenophilales bacterium CG03_land_8_20_14_0_80_62_28]|nr:DNA ligase [Betaproteobacteria bacterium]OIO76849.1 MAG: DNA ligase [Hydrogenophilaceae bacterium CG1_02_62_390]PIV22291.1 MAG: DNA ligase [Hydrogenophilales bacterium CG03_land_8_20_14_0_80_62_28]PIW39773.1 MAG: DNA ligase [Hydrogenophilales bacterium CG15_BIG_FIL_POST_REV_8_21_14_020_62_31]PIW72101.1 MAG: DNA ligase [Hydrogenophilales bacterium CG12_big_fil_rev_8_21_14_0_65_61_21]PIX01536.1 MAG: DNA ligase [Hydrogenophilales bacterium CG_4_8_14_3_um_filter_62_83]PIY98253.1 MAG: DNA ligas